MPSTRSSKRLASATPAVAPPVSPPKKAKKAPIRAVKAPGQGISPPMSPPTKAKKAPTRAVKAPGQGISPPMLPPTKAKKAPTRAVKAPGQGISPPMLPPTKAKKAPTRAKKAPGQGISPPMSPPTKAKKAPTRAKKAPAGAKPVSPPPQLDASPPKKRTVQLKGRAPVDGECPVGGSTHVYESSDGTLWDCMLNQTNLQNNNNKFYLIQVLESDATPNLYYVWMRWGRVGYKGQTSLTPCHANCESAQSAFALKFQSKTLNAWDERDSFCKRGGKYDMVALDYAPDAVADTALNTQAKDPKKPIPDSQLEAKVQELIRLICDVRNMERTVMEMEYDTKKAPLGKITNEQLKAGYSALKEVAELVNRGQCSGNQLIQACNDFYTRIPHEFGMRAPPLIRTNQEVKAKIELLEALGDIKIALSILNQGSDEDLNPVDQHYKNLKCELSTLDPQSQDHRTLSDYILTTHGTTHTSYSMDILDIYQVSKSAMNESFRDCGNRLLLFHGSRLSNWAGILGQGLRIAPPEAPTTGYMFGKGVYFADMSSKSANYCWTNKSNNIGLLMICEVALGQPNELLNAKYDANKLPQGTHSTKGMGKTAPDPKNYTKMSDGSIVPMGPGVNTEVTNPKGYTLMYNEYIVYDVTQIRMRYLAKLKFKYHY